MNTKTVSILVIAIFLAVINDVCAYLHRDGQNIVETDGHPLLLKCWGLGEWLNIENYLLGIEGEDVGSPSKPAYGHTAIRRKFDTLMGRDSTDEFYRRWVANIITEKDVAQYAQWGINAIRVSINYHWLSDTAGSYTPEGFALLDSIVSWGERHRIYIIFCMHAAPGGQNRELMGDVSDGDARLWSKPEMYQPWTIDLWKTIAKRFANRQWVGGYDLLDEPIINTLQQDSEDLDVNQNKTLLVFYKKLAAQIRSVDINHLLFVESAVVWSSDFTNLDTPFDSNMVYDFHHYDFDAVPWTVDSTGYADFFKLRKKTGLPIWNGETGEPDYGSDAENNKWAGRTASFCEKNNIGWCWWTTKKVDQKTNPFMIKSPSGFGKIRSAFNGSTISQSDAVKIMFELADNAATEKCTRNMALVNALGLDTANITPILSPKSAGTLSSFRIRLNPSGAYLKGFPFSGYSTVSLFDIHGRAVRNMRMLYMHKGEATLVWNKQSPLSRGLYIVRVTPLMGACSFCGIGRY